MERTEVSWSQLQRNEAKKKLLKWPLEQHCHKNLTGFTKEGLKVKT
jgi:hypothetical protein